MIRVAILSPKRNQGFNTFQDAAHFFKYLEGHFRLPARTFDYYKEAFEAKGWIRVATRLCSMSAFDDSRIAEMPGGLE